jgi:two-component system LytT family sensor kinase
MMKNNFIYHGLFWLGIYLLWVFVLRNYSFSLTKTMTVEFCYLIFITIDYYIAIYFIIPEFLKKKRYMWFALTTILLITFSALLRALVSREMGLYVFINSPVTSFGTLYLNSVVNIFIWVELIVLGKMILDRIYNQQQLALLEKERIKHELDFLKAQINPHALFNSLNAIYGHIDKSNQTARNTLLQFSGLLRYQLYDSMVDTISLEKEVEYIRNYIAFQKLRKDETLIVDVEINTEPNRYTIAPLLLVILLENAFKFVSSFADKENKITIKLTTANGLFTFNVCNTTDHIHTPLARPGGIGIANLKRRVELLYPGRHEISFNRQDDYYEANLKLKLE